jgi:hypothetical protein
MELASWLAVGIAGGSFVYTEIRVRSRQKFHKAAGPEPAELRGRLTDLRNLFNDVSAAGGQDNSWFLHPDRRQAAQNVRDQAARVDDDKLKAEALAAAGCWDHAYAWAPPETPPVVTWGGDDNPPGTGPRDQRLSQVADAAGAGVVHCEAAIARLNELEQAAPGE